MKQLFFLLLAVSCIQCAFAQKQQLGFNLVTGQTYFLSTQSSSSVKEDVQGQKVNIDMAISGTLAFKIIDQKDAVYEMDVTYEKLAMTLKLPNGNRNFNSEKPDPNDIFSSLLSEIKGKHFMMKMTKAGKISEVKNLDAIFEKMLDKFPKLPDAQKQQIQTQLKQSYGEKAFKGSFEMVTSIYTNDAVEKGSSWEITTKLETAMSATLNTTFTWKEKTDHYNLIGGSGKFTTEDKDAYTKVNGMPAKYDLTGTMTALIKVDPVTGWIIDAKIDQLLTGQAEIKDNPSLPGGMTIPMTLETVMSYSNE